MFTFAVLFRDNQFVAGTILAIGGEHTPQTYASSYHLPQNRKGKELKEADVAAALIYCGERLNALLAENWKSFAKQPYFDKAGIFFSAVVSVPWLLAMFVLLVSSTVPSCVKDLRLLCSRSEEACLCRCIICSSLRAC